MRHFHDLAIGQRFRWRDGEWIKTTYSHARPGDAPLAPDTFVPNQEGVSVVEHEPEPEAEDIVAGE